MDETSIEGVKLKKRDYVRTTSRTQTEGKGAVKRHRKGLHSSNCKKRKIKKD